VSYLVRDKWQVFSFLHVDPLSVHDLLRQFRTCALQLEIVNYFRNLFSLHFTCTC
jgi:hypothetical protein